MPDEVERFYDRSAENEWHRLERHRTEFAVTLRALEEYLAPPPARVLDVGGGPGRYAITLAQRGYAVTLFDLSHSLLDFAKIKANETGVELEDYVHGSATDLAQFPSDSFDVVLLMGPLYHLLEADDRQQAVCEARRVLKPGGLIFATFITRYAPIRSAARIETGWPLDAAEELREILETGSYHQASPNAGFTSAYFAHPNDITPLMETGGFQTQDMIACEGVVSMIEEEVNALTGDLWQTWVDLNYRLSKDPSIFGGVEHLLYVGVKGDVGQQ